MWSRAAGLSLGLLFLRCALAPPAPDAREVESFQIEGTEQLKEADIKAKVLTTESPWFATVAPWLVPKQWFDPLAWQADLRRIQRFYEANGYYQARILEEQVTNVEPQRVKLLVRLREGEPARLTALQFRGLEALPSELKGELLKGLPLEVKARFVEDDWALAKSTLAARLRELGFAEARVTGEALVDADTATVDASLTATTGLRYHFGKTFVATDPGAQIPASLIADVAAPDLKPEDWFSESAMAAAQARLFQMGVFAGVKVNRGAPDREAGTVPVVIDVREAPFRSVRLGGGLGGDLVRQEVRGLFEYTDRNLGFTRLFRKDARLDRLTFKAKLGVAFLPNVVEVIRAAPLAKWGPTWRLYAEYEIPRMLGLRELSFQGSADLQRTLDNAYNYDSLETKLGLIWRPRVDLTIFPSLNANGFFLYTPLELRETVPSGAVGCPQFPQVCLVGFVDLTAEFDHRDNKLEPKSGYFAAIDVAGGFSLTGKAQTFFKITPELRGYVSFGPENQFTLAARAKFGALLAPDNDTPIVMRYFSGGSSMRGFSQRRLSPQIAVPTIREDDTCKGTPGCPQLAYYNEGTSLPLGGSGLLEGALELRWSITENWVVAIFNDWGMVTDKPISVNTTWAQSLYTAVGFGVRYRTPLGPIRVDLGLRLPFVGGAQQVSNLAGTDGGEVRALRSAPGCFLGVGSGLPLDNPFTYGATPASYAGAPDNLCSAHLSIGEAF